MYTLSLKRNSYLKKKLFEKKNLEVNVKCAI